MTRVFSASMATQILRPAPRGGVLSQFIGDAMSRVIRDTQVHRWTDGAGSLRGRCGGPRGLRGPRSGAQPRGVLDLGVGPARPLPRGWLRGARPEVAPGAPPPSKPCSKSSGSSPSTRGPTIPRPAGRSRDSIRPSSAIWPDPRTPTSGRSLRRSLQRGATAPGAWLSDPERCLQCA
jgi:hypothetical protein